MIDKTASSRKCPVPRYHRPITPKTFCPLAAHPHRTLASRLGWGETTACSAPASHLSRCHLAGRGNEGSADPRASSFLGHSQSKGWRLQMWRSVSPCLKSTLKR